MYAPGNSVIVNMFMRWPVVAPTVVACCVVAAAVPSAPAPAPAPVPVVAPAPAPVVVAPTPAPVLPVLPAKKKIRG